MKKLRNKTIEAEIGVFGGSGFYNLLSDSREITIKTPYGFPSDKITVGSYEGKKVAFLPRHGKEHQYPPHKIPYLANIFAFKKIGVKKIIAPCAVGSLKTKIKPGDFVVCYQLLNFSSGRADTFYDGNPVAHVSMAEPYCPDLRRVAVGQARALNIKYHSKGTIAVINGPRFSTKAESRFFARQNGDIINMTAYPEAVLAREQGMCYLNIGLVTDYDSGAVGGKNAKAVTADDVAKVFKKNNEKIKEVIFGIIKNISTEQACRCAEHIKEAFIA